MFCSTAARAPGDCSLGLALQGLVQGLVQGLSLVQGPVQDLLVLHGVGHGDAELRLGLHAALHGLISVGVP